MARTLSPANLFALALIAVLGLILLADHAPAESPRPVPAPSDAATSPVTVKSVAPPSPVATIANPFTSPTLATTTAQGPRSTRLVTTTFRNPFSAESDSPQMESTLLPGARGRWRTSNSLLHTPRRPQSPTPSDTLAPKNKTAPTSEPTVLQLNPPLINATPDPATAPPSDLSQPALVITNDEPEPTPPESTSPRSADTTVKTAIVTAGEKAPADTDQRPFEPQFPLLSDVPDTRVVQLASPSALEPPDPARYTTGPSTPPAWLAPQVQTERPRSPIGQPLNRRSTPSSRPKGEAPFGADLTTEGRPSALSPNPERPAPIVEKAALEQLQPVAPPTESTGTIAPTAGTNTDTEPAIIADYDDSPSTWLVEAQEKSRTAQSLDDLSTVSQLCERVINANPRDKLAPFARKLAAWAHNRRGELLIEADQSGVALAEFQAAIDYDPQSSLAIHNRAVTLAQQNDFDAALIDFNRVIELNPGLAVAYRNRAELFAAQGKADEAIADYTHAIEAMPDDPELYRARAHALQQLDQFESALSDLDSSIRIAPGEAIGYAQRGNLLADRADYSRALNDFKQAIRIDPQLAEAQRGLAWIKATCPDERQRDAFEALTAAHTAVKLSSVDDYFALDVLAAAHANAGEFDKAIAVQEQAMSAAPEDAIPPMRARLNLYEHRQPYRVGR